MQIKKIKIIGLFGYINKEIDFFNDMTLLVGINGSGKTSVLNLINWIIKPSIPNLCVTEFSTIELTVNLKGVEYLITCKHTKSMFRYEIRSDKNNSLNPLEVRIKIPPKNIKNDENLRVNLLNEYTLLTPDEKEKKTWDLISTFPNPTIIGLDRTFYAEVSDRLFIEETTKRNVFKKTGINNATPLDRVKEIVNKEYRKRKNEILNLTSNLKNQLMLSAFEGEISLESFKIGINIKLTISQIENAEDRVKQYFNKIEYKVFSENEMDAVSKYFDHLKSITKQYHSNPNDEQIKFFYGLNASQFTKVNKLLKDFDEYEKESNKALDSINQYISTLNYFLKDSAKELRFNEETTELSFNTLDRQGVIIREYNDIKFLSSGEQQLLILFSYIAFNSQDGQIFIIDEPELSLHIKWQEEFLDYLEKITPKSTQLILATHSPILAGKKKEKAIVLLPYNN